ncbi:MAG: hypothetical protein M1831_000564 [Alyxoria varia]|nr:MAG: hypothetical protein M1831_000564 [Alyxoria varia]
MRKVYALKLEVQHEKRFQTPTDASLVRLCPKLDLVAVITAKNQLEVYRFDGQRSFTWSNGNPSSQARSLCWKPNVVEGHAISIVWDGGTVDFVNVAMGKLQNRLNDKKRAVDLSESRSSNNKPLKVSNHTWVSYLIEPALENKSIFSSHHTYAVKDNFNAAIDLPRELALLDVESELPLLSALPAINDKRALTFDAEFFTSLSGVLALFQPRGKRDIYRNTVDTQQVCWDDCYKTCMTGVLNFQPEASSIVTSQCSQPSSSCFACLIAPPTPTTDRSVKGVFQNPLSLQVKSLDALRESGQYYLYIVEKTWRLEMLSRYVTQSVCAIREAWLSGQQLSSRFIQSIQTTLSDEGQMDLDAALYHLAATGNCIEQVKEWLTEQLQDRGHKRWEEATIKSYTQVTTLTHETLLPALDRITLIGVRLRALARSSRPIPIFTSNMSSSPTSPNLETLLTRLIENAESFRIIAHNILQHATRELQLFRTFSPWLARQIEYLKIEDPDSSPEAFEAAEKAAAVDYPALLEYISGPLLKSHLNFFLTRSTDEVVSQYGQEVMAQCGGHSVREGEKTGQQQQLPVKKALLLQILERHRRMRLQPGGSVVEIVDALKMAFMLRQGTMEICNTPEKGFTAAERYAEPVRLGDRAVTSVSEEGRLVCDTRMVPDRDEKGTEERLATFAVYGISVADGDKGFEGDCSQCKGLALHKLTHHPYLLPITSLDSESSAAPPRHISSHTTQTLPFPPLTTGLSTASSSTKPSLQSRSRSTGKDSPPRLKDIRFLDDEILLALVVYHDSTASTAKTSQQTTVLLATDFRRAIKNGKEATGNWCALKVWRGAEGDEVMGLDVRSGYGSGGGGGAEGGYSGGKGGVEGGAGRTRSAVCIRGKMGYAVYWVNFDGNDGGR